MSGAQRSAGGLAARVAALGLGLLASLTFATTVLLGRHLSWSFGLSDGGGATVTYDLRDELPWLSSLYLGVLVAAVLAARLRRHPIPWLLAATGLGFLGFPATVVAVAYGRELGETGAWVATVAWVGNWIWLVGHAGSLYLLLLFPSGRPLTARWRVVGRVVGGYLVVVLLVVATLPTLEAAPELANPLAIPGLPSVEPLLPLLFAGFVVGQAAAVLCLVLRFVRSTGTERLQMTWMAAAAVVFLVLGVPQWLGFAPRWLQAVPTLLLVAAIVVAVTRYRLYEIGRLIRRTVSYSVLTLLLVGVYAVTILVLGAIARGATGSDSDLVVAASTLAVAATFRPLRRRVQAVVDRRFDRARYDAARAAERFAVQLRGEVDLTAVDLHLRRTVASTVQPTQVTVWRPRPAGPPVSARPPRSAHERA